MFGRAVYTETHPFHAKPWPGLHIWGLSLRVMGYISPGGFMLSLLGSLETSEKSSQTVACKEHQAAPRLSSG